jgi:hypothetical protein
MFDEVVEWEERASADVDASLRLLADEEREARRLANEATRRLGALGVLRREQGDELTKIEKESARRRRASVVAALAFDRELLAGRCRGVGPLQLEVPAGVGVLVSAQPPAGPTQALLVVLPAPYSVYEEGTHRPEDLATWLSYRAVSAVHELLVSVGAVDATVRFASLHESLAIQVWLGEAPGGGDLREPVMEHLGTAFEAAPELHSAGLEVYAVWIAPDLLAEGAA